MKATQVEKNRKALGWSRRELATRAGVTERTVQNVERGHTQPSLKTTRALDAALREGTKEQACES